MAEYHNVPVKRATWLRLRDYKMVSATYDDVLNQLMDSVPLEMLTEKVLAEHKHRIATFDGRDWRELREERRQRGKPKVSRSSS